MARPQARTLVINELRRGRNDSDPPGFLPAGQCVEALNVEPWEGTLGRKRNGSSTVSLTGGTFSGTVRSLQRYVPAGDETLMEFFAFDSAITNGNRLAGGATWASVTLTDAPASAASLSDMTSVGLGGFCHFAYDTSQNRMHLWDASLSKIRRSGLATPSAPSAATLGGSGLSFTRFYAIRYTDVSGSDTRRRSERSASTSITITDDSGVQITKPSGLSEDETNWEVLASDDGTAGTWYRLTTQAVGSTTYNDTNATIPTTTEDVEDGINYPPPSCRVVLKFNGRLVFVGAWETSGGYVTPKSTRVWWSPVIGDNDIGDLERVPTGFYRDAGDALIAAGGPINGGLVLFGGSAMYKLQPTGLAGVDAFELVPITNGIGCLKQSTVQMGEDENGNPALYFLSHRGPYRYGVNGLQYLGNDIEATFTTTNFAASNTLAHSCWHPEKRQWWLWLSTGSANQPDGTCLMVFNVPYGQPFDGAAVHFGWTKYTGLIAGAYCSCLFSKTPGAAMSRNLLPHVGDTNGNILKGDDSTVTADNAQAFQAYIETGDYFLGDSGALNAAVLERHLIARVSSGVTITCTVIADTDATTTGFSVTSTVTLTAVGSETVAKRKFQSGELSNASQFRFRLGDSAAASNAWTLDALIVRYQVQESV